MASTQNPMETIWEKIPKQKDGKTIRYSKADLDYLYFYGFVDTRRYKLEEWKNAFKPFRQPDESCVLNRNQFLALRKFRYMGDSDEVFEPVKIKDGPWTDDQLKALYLRSIHKASDITEKTFWAYVNSLKKSGLVDEKGNLVISEAVKVGLWQLIEDYPSPRRRLEKEVHRIRAEREQKLGAAQKSRDQSVFAAGKTASEATAEAYKDFLSTRPAKTTVPGPEKQTKKKEEIDIKKLRKPGPKITG